MLSTLTEGNVVTDLFDDRNFETGDAEKDPTPVAADLRTAWIPIDDAIAEQRAVAIPHSTPDQDALVLQIRVGNQFTQAVADHRQGLGPPPPTPSLLDIRPWPLSTSP